MSTEEQARKLMAEERKHKEHLDDSMLTRACEEVEHLEIGETEERARELVTENRKHEEHVHETMLNRANEEITTK